VSPRHALRSQYVKAGFAGENFPRHVFPSMVGRPVLRAEEELLGDVELKDVMVGQEASDMRRALEVSYPVENGIIRNWDDMELIWNHTFRDLLGVDPAGKKLMLTEPPMNPTTNKKRMISTMFEKYNLGGVQVWWQALLTLYGQGMDTGLVVDSGDGVTHVVAVYDNVVIPHLTRRLDVAGRHLTRYLIKLLLLRGYAFNRSADFQTVQEIKEKLCYVACETEVERRLAAETTVLVEKYTLPDDTEITIGPERFEASEALFSPKLIDVESAGLSDMVFDLIQAADMDLRPSFYKSIVLSGGTTMFPGLPSRLEFDLKRRYLNEIVGGDEKRLKKMGITVIDPPRRKHLVFSGASYIAHIMRDRDSFWITKAEFEEHGIDRVVAKTSAGGGRKA
jgi:actin-related protein 2